MDIDEYDQWTINYLIGVGVEPGLVDRVRRMAKDLAVSKAEAEAWKKTAHDASKVRA